MHGSIVCERLQPGGYLVILTALDAGMKLQPGSCDTPRVKAQRLVHTRLEQLLRRLEQSRQAVAHIPELGQQPKMRCLRVGYDATSDIWKVTVGQARGFWRSVWGRVSYDGDLDTLFAALDS